MRCSAVLLAVVLLAVLSLSAARPRHAPDRSEVQKQMAKRGLEFARAVRNAESDCADLAQPCLDDFNSVLIKVYTTEPDDADTQLCSASWTFYDCAVTVTADCATSEDKQKAQEIGADLQQDCPRSQ